jgi:cyclic lactone autoinducer peptide
LIFIPKYVIIYLSKGKSFRQKIKIKRQEFVMKKISRKIMEAAAKVGMNTAVKACGSASLYGCHQPKEPKALKEIVK